MFKKYFSELSFFTRDYQKLLGIKFPLYLLAMLIPAFLDGIGITMIVPLLNLVISDKSIPIDSTQGQNFAYSLLSFFHVSISLNNILLFILSLYVFKFVVTFANSVFKSYLYALVLKRTKTKLYQQISEMEYLDFQKRSTGFYSNLVGVQVSQYLAGFLYLAAFFSALISAIAYLSFSFFVDFKFSLLASISGAVFALLLTRLNKAVKKLSHKTTDNETRTSSFFIEAVQSFKYLKATAGYTIFLDRLEKEVEAIRSQSFKSESYRGFFLSVYEPLIIFLICSFIFIQVSVMGHSVVGMLLSIYLFHRALSNIMITQKDWQYLMNYNGGIHAVSEQLQQSKDKKEKSGETILNEPISEINFENLSFAYGDEGAVIKDFTLKIEKNKTIAFVGQSGAGKTTLVDIITMLNKPTAGKLFINGLPCEEVDLENYRKQIGLVTQEVNLYDDTVANNISLWQPHQEEMLNNTIEKAYAKEFIQNLPDGSETRIGDRGLRLSGGQKQRLSLARELFKNPSLLILDEATSALDSESESFIKDTLDALKGKLTIVMIAHRLSTVREADLIVVLKDGRITNQGTFKELSEKDEYFRKIVHLQKVS